MASYGDTTTHGALLTAVYRILKSLAKLSIRLGLSAGAMSELVRRAYLDAAEEIILDEGDKVLTTKVCAMTGLYRKEIIRLRNLPPLADPTHDDRYNRSARVVTGWLRDSDYHTDKGNPAALKLQGPGSFAELVKRYSGDMAPTAMQQELERLGVVTLTSRNLVKLAASGYLSSTNTDGLQILGTDTADLINTIHDNILSKKENRRFQRKVNYVDIPQQFVEPFKIFSAAESQKLLEKLDHWLSERDSEAVSEKAGSRIGLGIYHIEHRNKPKDTSGADRTK